MYEMLTGKLPFEGETALQVVMQHLNAVPLAPSERQPDVPKGLDEVVMHAMCADYQQALYVGRASGRLDRLKDDANAQFHYSCVPDRGGRNAGALGREVQQAARTPVSPQERDRTGGRDRRAPAPEPEPKAFERLAERPGLAAGIAVAVFAVKSRCW